MLQNHNRKYVSSNLLPVIAGPVIPGLIHYEEAW